MAGNKYVLSIILNYKIIHFAILMNKSLLVMQNECMQNFVCGQHIIWKITKSKIDFIYIYVYRTTKR